LNLCSGARPDSYRIGTEVTVKYLCPETAVLWYSHRIMQQSNQTREVTRFCSSLGNYFFFLFHTLYKLSYFYMSSHWRLLYIFEYPLKNII